MDSLVLWRSEALASKFERDLLLLTLLTFAFQARSIKISSLELSFRLCSIIRSKNGVKEIKGVRDRTWNQGVPIEYQRKLADTRY